MRVLECWQREMIAIYRIMVGFLLASHGAVSLRGVLESTGVGLFDWPTGWIVGIQFFGGSLVMIGLGTRYAALLCAGWAAYTYVAGQHVNALLPIQNGGESEALFCLAFLLICFLGNGTWSIDQD
ncbi:DoxX family protein [Kribbella sp. NPDC056861]|uniref:DoxX family protein n=1 Tax=Kribbella sp. NPDC056861 TaxID=3154857 RepID=UPI00341F8EDA